jgi:hypothetical protein
MSFGGSKSKNKSVESGWQKNTLDPYMEEMRRRFGDAAQTAANAPVNPNVSQAQDYYNRTQNLGLGAQRILGGDQAAIQGAMNPYIGNVIDAAGMHFQKLRDQATMGLNDQATQAGAFGGSRHGVAQGVALGEIYGQEGAARANLLKQGFDDVMSRAQFAANLGFGAAGAGAELGDMHDPAMRAFRIYQQTVGSTPYTVNSDYKNRSTQTGMNAGFKVTPFPNFA